MAERLGVALRHPGIEGRLAADDLRLALRQPSRLDLPSWTAVIAALNARGHSVSASFVPAPLATGETWLLLAAGAHGEAWRLRVQVEANPPLFPFTSRPLPEEPRDAVDALRALFRVKQWGIPEMFTGVRPNFVALPSSLGVAVRGVPNEAPGDAAVLHGRSLDLAAAVALTSAWMRRPPRAEIAGTARLAPSGTLFPVDEVGLETKLRALVARWPQVRRVVVADGQPVRDIPGALQLVPCANLDEALGNFFEEDLDARFPPRDPHEALALLATLPFLSGLDLHPRTWADHSRRAEGAANALSPHRDELPPYRAAHDQALGFAVHFAVAAGDLSRAEELLARLPHEDPGGTDTERLQAASVLAIVRAAHAINALVLVRPGDPSAKLRAQELALAHAQAAHELGQRLPRTDGLSLRLRGRAHGTLGRARLHAGSAEEACEILARNAAEQVQYVPTEAPRSLCYLATAQRRAGRTAEALRTVDEAFARTRRLASHESARRYLLLERGRCLLELARPEEALRDFDAVLDGGDADRTHPHLGALRGRATALVRLGRPDEAAALRQRCRVIAADPATPVAFRWLAALPVAEGFLEHIPPPGTDDAVDAVLVELFGEGFDRARARELLDDAVY